MDLRVAAVMPDIVLTPPASRKLPEPSPSSSMAEQWTFNPLVGGSSPPGGTSKFNFPEFYGSWFSLSASKTNELGRGDAKNFFREISEYRYKELSSLDRRIPRHQPRALPLGRRTHVAARIAVLLCPSNN